jgi:multiple antibiotic resistance protein
MGFQLHNAGGVLEASTLVIAALFPIVNPSGGAAVFEALVGRFDFSLQLQLAKKIAVYSFFLLFVSMLYGGKILLFFGVSLHSVQIGGGLVVAN